MFCMDMTTEPKVRYAGFDCTAIDITTFFGAIVDTSSNSLYSFSSTGTFYALYAGDLFFLTEGLTYKFTDIICVYVYLSLKYSTKRNIK